jgi:hypothetical protein
LAFCDTNKIENEWPMITGGTVAWVRQPTKPQIKEYSGQTYCEDINEEKISKNSVPLPF